MAKVVTVGLEQATAQEIERALRAGRHQVDHKPEGAQAIEWNETDIVFVGGTPETYLSLLRHIQAVRPFLPVVIVTRLPETGEWLDALEAGAADYCSAPFETRHIEWLMESSIPLRGSVAA